jgi:hypothetical protein
MHESQHDFIRVVDADGGERHLNLAAVIAITFDLSGTATIDTIAAPSSLREGRYIVTGEEAARLRAALARREEWADAPKAGRLPEFRQSPTRPRPL